MSGPPTTPPIPGGAAPAWPSPSSFPYPPAPPKKSDNVVLIIVLVVVLVVVVSVIIAAVLYVMVSGLITGPGPTPRLLGMTISRSADGTNWTLLVSSAPSGLAAGGTFLTVRSSSGSVVLNSKSFSALTWPADRAVYQGDGDAFVETGELLFLSSTTYFQQYRVEVREGSQILWAGVLG